MSLSKIFFSLDLGFSFIIWFHQNWINNLLFFWINYNAMYKVYFLSFFFQRPPISLPFPAPKKKHRPMCTLRPGRVCSSSRLPAPKLMMILCLLEKGIHISLVPLGLCWIKSPFSKIYKLLTKKAYSKYTKQQFW